MQARGSRGVQLVAGYAIFDEIASGGMASVYLARPIGADPSSPTVAIKRLHPHYAKDPDFFSMFTDEARVAARIRHRNVVPTLEVVTEMGELFLVMELVHGESLGKLLRVCRDRGERVPPAIAASIVSGVLEGLQAAHDATGEGGDALHIVHRDVSPQNVMVGDDGIARVLDFGVAKARGRVQTTREGQLKGKLSYMAPEQLDAREIDRRTDVFSAGAVLWEVLIGKRLFDGVNEAAVLRQVIAPNVTPPSEIVPELAPFDSIIAKALAAEPADRFESARAMAIALDVEVTSATAEEVSAWVTALAGPAIERRARRVREIERAPIPDPAGSAEPAQAETEVAPPPESVPEPPEASPPPVSAPFAIALHHSDPPTTRYDPDDMGAETLPLHDRMAPLSSPPSQVSSISVSSQLEVPPPLPPQRVKMLAAVAVGAATVVSLSLVLVLSLTSHRAVETLGSIGAVASSAAAQASAAAETSPPAADPAPPPAETAAPAESASAPAPPPVRPAPPIKRPTPVPAVSAKKKSAYGF